MFFAPNLSMLWADLPLAERFERAGPRSTLNTVPDAGPSASPSATGSNSLMPADSAATPAPVIAEPKNTGCTSARRDCAARAARSWPYPGAVPGPRIRGQNLVVLAGQEIAQRGR